MGNWKEVFPMAFSGSYQLKKWKCNEKSRKEEVISGLRYLESSLTYSETPILIVSLQTLPSPSVQCITQRYIPGLTRRPRFVQRSQ